MRRSVVISLSLIAATLVAATGYWIGLRKGFALGDAASAVERGGVAAEELRLLDAAKTTGARFYLEAGVDDGLIGWDELTRSRFTRFSLALIAPGLPDYATPWLRDADIRRLANYRNLHVSPVTLPAAMDDISAKCRGQPGCIDIAPAREREAVISRITDEFAR